MAMKPVEVEILMKDRLSGALDKAGRKVDELKGKATAASSEMDSQAQRLRTAIAGLTEQMEELRGVGQNASPNLDQSENMAGIEALEKQIAELESRLKQLDATAEATQTVPPELPAAKQQFNGLHMSIQQMAREMPSLAMGPQMFFLAISTRLYKPSMEPLRALDICSPLDFPISSSIRLSDPFMALCSTSPISSLE